MDDAQYLKEYSLEEFIEARQQMNEKLQLLQEQKSNIESQIQQIQMAMDGTNAPKYSALRGSAIKDEGGRYSIGSGDGYDIPPR